MSRQLNELKIKECLHIAGIVDKDFTNLNTGYNIDSNFYEMWVEIYYAGCKRCVIIGLKDKNVFIDDNRKGKREIDAATKSRINDYLKQINVETT